MSYDYYHPLEIEKRNEAARQEGERIRAERAGQHQKFVDSFSDATLGSGNPQKQARRAEAQKTRPFSKKEREYLKNASSLERIEKSMTWGKSPKPLPEFEDEYEPTIAEQIAEALDARAKN